MRTTRLERFRPLSKEWTGPLIRICNHSEPTFARYTPRPKKLSSKTCPSANPVACRSLEQVMPRDLVLFCPLNRSLELLLLSRKLP